MEVSEIVAIILTLAKYLVIGATILLCVFILIALFKPFPNILQNKTRLSKNKLWFKK